MLNTIYLTEAGHTRRDRLSYVFVIRKERVITPRSFTVSEGNIFFPSIDDTDTAVEKERARDFYQLSPHRNRERVI